MNTFAIQTQNLTKHFGDIPAVNGIDLHVKPGEMFGIVGPDGAGKTTTLRMLCGVIPPTSGSAHVLGLDVVHDKQKLKHNIGYLSQRFSLYGDLTIDENIEFFAEIHQVKDYKKRRQELLDLTRLTPFRKRFADRLSGGMKQKLALACTLIHIPQVIFLDEPTTGVDPVSRRDFWKILASLLKTGITIVMSTPYLDEAERCNRVAMMSHGAILITQTPSMIKKEMKGDLIEIMCDDVRRAFNLLKMNDAVIETQAFGDRVHVVVMDASRDVPPVLAQLESAQVRIIQVRPISPSLENVFISLLQATAHQKEQANDDPCN
ncbi:MAG: ABC transporter ATP-binding protein [Gemmatimonadetes bacterium]|nr:MAG: ABC transporter ATP-binding protein [Gemmatimonadota bacterium]